MRTLFLASILFISINSYSQLKYRGAFDYFIGGYNTSIKQPSQYNDFDYNASMNYGNYRIRVGADYKIKKISLFFDQFVYMSKPSGVSFKPVQAEWYAGIRYNITKEIRVEFEHLCIHSVQSNIGYDPQAKQYGGYNMISINYGY